jgi:amidohydrolase
MDIAQLKASVTATIREHQPGLVELSHTLWADPELCYEEHHAHAVLTDALESAGFAVERGAGGLDTAFRADWPVTNAAEGRRVAMICEYDALPEIGHACGHNVIAAAGFGAAIGAAAVVEELGGALCVIGTPAEEGGGGKAKLLDAGVFDDVDIAMMVHPADADLDAFWAIAIEQVIVRFHGKAAHAAAAPEQGRNALDAAVLAYNNIAALRQHIAAHERIHGIFVHGGDKPNVVPHFAEMQWYVRSGTSESLQALKPRVVAALEAGAIATGCEIELEWVGEPYDDLVQNRTLDRLYANNVAPLGRLVAPRETSPGLIGSTDMGNVSHRIPSLHPMIKVAPSGIAIHTAAFAEFAGAKEGDVALVDGAIGLAHTAVDLWSDPSLIADAHQELPSDATSIHEGGPKAT